MSKIKTLDEIIDISRSLQDKNKTVGMVTGVFDIIHLGHLRLFEEAKKHADCLIVGVDEDSLVKTAKGEQRPIIGLEHRMHTLCHVSHIDFVFPIMATKPILNKNIDVFYGKVAKSIMPNCIITNKACDSSYPKKQKQAKKLGIEAILLEGKKINSTTDIINKILEVYTTQ